MFPAGMGKQRHHGSLGRCIPAAAPASWAGTAALAADTSAGREGPGIRDIVFLAGSGGCQKPDKLITSDMGQSSSGVRSLGPLRRCCCRSARIHQAARLPRRAEDFWEGAAAARVGLDHCGPQVLWSSSSCLCLALLPPDITCFGAGPGWVAAGSWGMGMDLGFVQLLAQRAACSGAAGVPVGTQSPGRLSGMGMCGRKRCRAWQECSCWRSQAAFCGPSAQSLQAGVLYWELRSGCSSVLLSLGLGQWGDAALPLSHNETFHHEFYFVGI